MTDPMNPTRPQHAPPQSISPDVLRDLNELLEDGLPVFDLNGEHVGDVKEYQTAAGYLFVGSGAFGHRDLYIPYRLIRGITSQRITLSEPKDVLIAQYTEAPTIHTFVEYRHAPDSEHRDTSDTLPPAEEVRVVQSGYDGSPMVVDSVELSSIAERLSLGLAVFDRDGVRLGDITEYDTEQGVLTVEKGIFNPGVLYVPFSAIARIDRDALSVSLTVPRADLLREQARLSPQS